MIDPRQKPVSTRRRGSAGFSLVELTVAMFIVSLIGLAIGASLVLAGKALPDADAATEQVASASRVLQQLTDELQSAIYVTERSNAAIRFTVADRDGDGCPERIRYSWSGVPGDPLTHSYNSGNAVTILQDVHQFALSYALQSSSETYPGPLIEDSEILVSSYWPTLGLVNPQEFKVEKDKWPGQRFTPNLPAEAMKWRLTRIQFRAKKDGPATENMSVQLWLTDGNGLPSGTAIQSVIVPESSFSSSMAWGEVPFNTTELQPGVSYCLTFANASGSGVAGRIQYDNNGGVGLLSTGNSGLSYLLDLLRSTAFYVYGKPIIIGPSQTASRKYVMSVGVTLQAGSNTASGVQTSVRTVNQPEALSAVWHARFDTNPTTQDIGGDGTTDWVRRDGAAFNTAGLVGGVWRADTTLDTRPLNDFTELTTVDLHCRATSVGGSAVFWICADWAAGQFANIYAYLTLQSDNTQTFTLYTKSNDSTPVTLLTVPGLGNGFVNLRLLIDPALNTVNVKVNGSQMGTFRYLTYAPPHNNRVATILNYSGNAKFDEIWIRVGGNQP